ncbi:MAG: hypothetical protein AAF351_09485 [Pseudomonadota bacterium]
MPITDHAKALPSDGRQPLLLWLSRCYLRFHISGESLPSELFDFLQNPARRNVYQALSNVWDVMLSSTHEGLALHDPFCPCLSTHEQALIMGLGCIETRTPRGFKATMLAIVPPTAVRVLEVHMQVLADAIAILESNHDIFLTSLQESQNDPHYFDFGSSMGSDTGKRGMRVRH